MGTILPFPNTESINRAVDKATAYRQQTAAEALLMDNLIEKFRRHLRATRANSEATVKLALEKVTSAAKFIGKPVWLWNETDIEEFFFYKIESCNIAVSTLSGYYTYLRKFQNFLLTSIELAKLIQDKFGVGLSIFVTESPPIPLRNKGKKRKKPIQTLSKEECEILIDCLEKEMSSASKWGLIYLQRNKAIMIMLLTTGVRVSELVKMKIGDFTVICNDNNEKVYTSVYVVGKNQIGRNIEILFNVTSDTIDWYLKNVRWNYLKNKNETIDLMFYSERGSAISECQINLIVKQCCALAGINKDITTHSLRHTYTTHVAPLIGATATQRQLGHANLATTLGTYYHPNIKDVLNDITNAASNKLRKAKEKNAKK